MAKKRRKTQYTRQRNRVTAYIRRLRKQGLEVDLYFPTEYELRKSGVKGSELGALTKKLKHLTPKVLKQISQPITKAPQDTTIKQGFDQQENILEGGIANVIVNNFKSQILHFPKEISNLVIGLINTLINEQGLEDVAYALEHMPLQFYDYINRKGYDSKSSIQEFSSSLIEYLPNASETYKSDLMDAFEYNEIGYTIES